MHRAAIPSICPSAWVRRFSGLVAPGGAVLDVACGGGRHLRHFRAAGHPVIGVDRDIGGLADLFGEPGTTIIAYDLEEGSDWPLPAERRFAGIVVTNYLYRPLFPVLVRALAPGGVLIYETFAVGNQRYGRPSNPDFLLRPGELLELAIGHGLTVAAFEQGRIEQPQSAVVQRLCAIRPLESSDGSALNDHLFLFRIDAVPVQDDGGNL